MKITTEVKIPVFKIKRKHPLCADDKDDRLFLDIPDVEFAKQIAKRIPKLIARYERAQKEGVKNTALQFIFTGDFHNLNLI